MLKWFRKSQTAIPDIVTLKEVPDIAGLILSADKYGNDSAKRQEAIVALGAAVGYWSGYRLGPADKAGVRTLMEHLKNDPNQGIRLAAGRALSQLRGLSMMGDAAVAEVDISRLSHHGHHSCFQKEELEGVDQALHQDNWPLALERIERILMLPEDASQTDDLVQEYTNKGGDWPMDNQPTAIAVCWLRGYLKNLDDADKELAATIWALRGHLMYEVFVRMPIRDYTYVRDRCTVRFRMDTVKGLIYTGATREVFWDNANAVAIAGCLLYYLAQGEKLHYEKVLEFVTRADKLKPDHAHVTMCRDVVAQSKRLLADF